MATDADLMRAVIHMLDTTQRGLAAELEIDDRQMRRYCAGKLPVPKVVRLAVQHLLAGAEDDWEAGDPEPADGECGASSHPWRDADPARAQACPWCEIESLRARLARSPRFRMTVTPTGRMLIENVDPTDFIAGDVGIYRLVRDEALQ